MDGWRCRNAAINVVVCHAVSQQAAFVSHFSLTCPLIKTSMRRNLTTTIVFDELVVKGEQAHQRHCLCHHVLCCDTDGISIPLCWRLLGDFLYIPASSAV